MNPIKTTLVITALAAGTLTLAAPALASTNDDPCASYVYKGTQINLCHDFPGAQDRDCPQIGHPVRVIGVDAWQLDKNTHDADTVGCESYPLYVPHTTKPSATPSRSPRPTKSATPAPAPHGTTGPQLPVTGPGGPILGGVGATVLAAGGVLLLAARRRRTRFTA